MAKSSSRAAIPKFETTRTTSSRYMESNSHRSTEGSDEVAEPSDHITVSVSTPSTDARRPTTDLAVYKYYFSALGWFRISALLLFLVTEAGMSGFRYVWVDLWSSSSDNATASRLGYWLGLYGAFSIIQALSLILAVFAPLSFLSNVNTGALVTRFSQDMRLVDIILPRGFISTGFPSLPYLAAVLPLLLRVLYLIQRFYLKTSRQLRLLECVNTFISFSILICVVYFIWSFIKLIYNTYRIELKSPLYTYFIESLAGVTTIRAFSWTYAATSRMISMLDTAQRPYYLLLYI
ncbi:hypothetical protein N7445_002519 [Penicillium cf. griseofulvum]|nr:hypothetical protein N7445_002519 [Penicillium cf. griseofulvum]